MSLQNGGARQKATNIASHCMKAAQKSIVKPRAIHQIPSKVFTQKEENAQLNSTSTLSRYYSDRFEQQARDFSRRWREGEATDSKYSAGITQSIYRANPAAYYLQSSRSEPLPFKLRAKFEKYFHADLSAVRIHCDSEAQAAAEREQAKAFTAGSHIYFAKGMYDPESEKGQELLAHECTHTLQQAARMSCDNKLKVMDLKGSGEIQHDLLQPQGLSEQNNNLTIGEIWSDLQSRYSGVLDIERPLRFIAAILEHYQLAGELDLETFYSVLDNNIITESVLNAVDENVVPIAEYSPANSAELQGLYLDLINILTNRFGNESDSSESGNSISDTNLVSEDVVDTPTTETFSESRPPRNSLTENNPRIGSTSENRSATQPVIGALNIPLPTPRRAIRTQPTITQDTTQNQLLSITETSSSRAVRSSTASRVELIMPEPRGDLTDAELSRLASVNQAATIAATRQSELPDSESSVEQARATVVITAEETRAEIRGELIDALGEEPAPSPEIISLCSEIMHRIRERRPTDENSLLRANPEAEARDVGGRLQETVDNASQDVNQNYSTINTPVADQVDIPGRSLNQPSMSVDTAAIQATRAMPDATTEEDISLQADISEGSQRITDAGMDTEVAQAVQSGPIADARTAQDELEEISDEEESALLLQQAEARATAINEMANLEQRATEILRASRRSTVDDLVNTSSEMQTSEEAQRADVTSRADAIFSSAQQQVNVLLQPLETIVNRRWETGIQVISTDFERDLQEVERWKQDYYAGVSGWFREKFEFGMPPFITEAYDQAEEDFGASVCDLLLTISSEINGVIRVCEGVIENASQRISSLFENLPDNLDEWAREKLTEYESQLSGLNNQVSEARDTLSNNVADQSRAVVQEVRERVQGLREEAGGLFGRIVQAIEDFKENPALFIINGLLELAGIAATAFWALMDRIESVADDIARRPMVFANNLGRALRLGFNKFFDNFARHMGSGLFEWLPSELDNIGVNVPEQFTVKSSFVFILELLGFTWARIRRLLVDIIGERNVELIEKATQFLSQMIELGPTGIYEMIKDRLEPGALVEQVTQSAIGFVKENLIKNVAIRVVSMFNPAGALFQVMNVIYRIIRWVFKNAARIFTLVETVVTGVTRLLAGNIQSMAEAVETSLARMISPVIDFFAGLLGFGDLPDRIADTIKGFQDRLWQAITRAVRALVERAKAFLRRLRGEEDEDDDDGESIPFTAEDGDQHTLYDDENSDELMIRSTPTLIETMLNDITDENLQETKIAAAAKYQETQALKVEIDSPGIEDVVKQTKKANRRVKLEDLVNLLKELFPDHPVRTDFNYTGVNGDGFGMGVDVDVLTLNIDEKARGDNVIPGGSRTTTSISSTGKWADLWLRRTAGGSSFYVQGHLLNNHLGGTGIHAKNLTPLTRSTNALMSSRFEENVKREVLQAGKAVMFKVTPVYDTSHPLEDKVEGLEAQKNPDAEKKAKIIKAEKQIPSAISCEFTVIEEGAIKQITAPDPLPNSIFSISTDDYILVGGGGKDKIYLSDENATDIQTKLLPAGAASRAIAVAISQSTYRRYAQVHEVIKSVQVNGLPIGDARARDIIDSMQNNSRFYVYLYRV